MAMFNIVKEEMLKGLVVSGASLDKIQLKYAGGGTSAVKTVSDMFGAPVNDRITFQNTVTFDIDTSSGSISITGYKLIFEDDDSVGFEFDFEQVYLYPTNGVFNFGTDAKIIIE